MRYIVLGAGAVGSALGGMLAHHHREAVLIGRPAHVQAIQQHGLIILSPTERWQISLPAYCSLAEVLPTPTDCILLTVKSQDTTAALTEILTWAKQYKIDPTQLPIVCLQNGVRNEAMVAAQFKTVIGALVHFNANFLSPGQIERPLWNIIALGNYAATPEAQADLLLTTLVADFTGAGFQTTIHPHIMQAKWGKLLANLNNATNAITNTDLQRALTTPAHRQFMAAVMQEGIEIIDQTGIRLDDGGIFDARAMVVSLRTPPSQDAKWTVATGQPSYPSTWQDLMLGRSSTEVEFFNGEIVTLAASLGRKAPYNQLLLTTIREMVAKKARPGYYTLAELQAQLDRS